MLWIVNLICVMVNFSITGLILHDWKDKNMPDNAKVALWLNVGAGAFNGVLLFINLYIIYGAA